MKLIIDIPEEIVTAIQNGQDYRYDIHTVIAQGKPYDTSGDLISRVALKDFAYINKGNFNTVESIREWIDNAPTVEPRIEIGTDGQPYRLFMSSAEKPQGEWIETNSYDENIICSFCKTEFNGDIKLVCGGENPNYCPNCGADMRGDKK